MNSIITRENVLKEKLSNTKEGNLVLELLKLSQEFGFENCIDIFSMEAQLYVKNVVSKMPRYDLDDLYIYMMNICYVVELYLLGFYNQEHYMGYEEFLKLVQEGKTVEVIEASRTSFMLHINRLKKIIVKSKKKLPPYSIIFNDTRELLKELDKDLSLCEKYPFTSINLSEFYFGKYNSDSGPIIMDKLVGFIAMEKYIYSLYNELCILSEFDESNINRVCLLYRKMIGLPIPYNIFEKVINNYLFAQPYSDTPEDLRISKVDADLLIREIKMGTLNATELINQLIDKFSFSEHEKAYLEEYGNYTQKRIDALKDSSYFGELFIISPPE